MKTIRIDVWNGIPNNFTGIAEFWSGKTIWYKDGEIHREDGGPAIEYRNGTKSWCQNGKLHRTDGPAVVRKDGYAGYWINGIKTCKEGMEIYAALFPEEK